MINLAMVKKITQLLVLFAGLAMPVNAQPLTPEQYIEMYKDIAIREMKRMGVPAAITLAQGLLETESGNSVLVKKSNNHFGIKCKSTWTAAGVSHDDDAVGECFRIYKTAEDSYRDHSNFLRGSERYAFLFSLSPTDYKAWARGLKTAGYATNPNYPNILIKNIELYNLQQYSLAGAAGVPVFDNTAYKDDPVVFDKELPMEKDAGSENAGTTNDQEAPVIAAGELSTINGIKCLNATKGTSLLAIASQYNIGLQKLLEINELEEDGILEQDQLIFLQKKAKTCDKEFVLVKKPKTLYDIAQENGIQLESLLEYNQLSEDGDVVAGTRIYLRPGREVALAAANKQNPVASKTVVYEVRAKDGLYGVARKYSVTVQQLREWNKLSSDDLKVGQQLIVGK
jgi:LysM repeat protein